MENVDVLDKPCQEQSHLHSIRNQTEAAVDIGLSVFAAVR